MNDYKSSDIIMEYLIDNNMISNNKIKGYLKFSMRYGLITSSNKLIKKYPLRLNDQYLKDMLRNFNPKRTSPTSYIWLLSIFDNVTIENLLLYILKLGKGRINLFMESVDIFKEHMGITINESINLILTHCIRNNYDNYIKILYTKYENELSIDCIKIITRYLLNKIK